jgi:O-6-methylguanine DNA methyltransferase
MTTAGSAHSIGDYEARMLRLLKTHYGDTTLAPGPTAVAVRRALDAYFAGDLEAIDDIPVGTGGTPFQRTVWAALRRIPAGTTTSYGALAAIIGRPSAMRAVGLAVSSNPVAVIVPCHRVIGADHSLTGYGGARSQAVAARARRPRAQRRPRAPEASGQHRLTSATFQGGEARFCSAAPD